MLLLNKFYKKSKTTETQKKSLKKNTSGATAIEYALIAACLAIALIGAFQGLKGKLSDKFTSIGTKISSAS